MEVIMKKIFLIFFMFMIFVGGVIYGKEVKITIFHTNDTHGRGLDDNSIGYGKVTTYVKQYKALDKNVLFLDAGDAFNGLPVIDLSLGRANLDVMNLMGYDAFTAGNADFVQGGEQILKLEKAANFPFLSSNIYYKGKLAFKPYIIKEIDGVKIGIIGVSPMNSMVATVDSKLEGFTITDAIKEVEKQVKIVRGKADVVIILAHLGKTDPEVNVQKLVETVPGIDIIVDGHDHVLIKEGMKIKDTFVVNAGQYNEYLGVLELKINNKKLVSANAKLLGTEDFKDITADKNVEELIQKIKKENEKILSREVMRLPFTLEGRREFVRSQQTSFGSVLADAEREYTGADVSITVGAFLRESIEAGPVTYGKVFSALPFTLPTVTRNMTGKQIVDFIEHNYTEPKIISPAYTHVSGMTFTVDFSRPVGSRMTDIMIGGKPVDMNKIYVLACNEQISDFGIRDTKIEKTYDITMAQLLIDYINKHPDIKEPENRVTIKK
jgi:5'-nucleotidase/UDP-sugar diphosphatase